MNWHHLIGIDFLPMKIELNKLLINDPNSKDETYKVSFVFGIKVTSWEAIFHFFLIYSCSFPCDICAHSINEFIQIPLRMGFVSGTMKRKKKASS